MKVLVAQSCGLFASPRAIAHQAPLSMEFSRQEYWSGWAAFPLSGDLLDPGIEPRSPALQADSLPSELMLTLNLHHQTQPRFWPILAPLLAPLMSWALLRPALLTTGVSVSSLNTACSVVGGQSLE